MLLDRYRQLLTAYVDGELSSRQRRYIARLLHRSAEARQLLQQLQEDAQALRHLPYPQLPVDLSASVLQTIAERRLTPGRRRIAKVSSPSVWSGPLASWAVAAGVLLVLGIASYLYFAASLTHSDKTDLAETSGDPSLAAPDSHASPPTPVAPQEKPPAVVHEKPSPAPERPSVVKQPEVVKRPPEEPKKPSQDPRPTPPKEEPVLTDRMEMFQFSKVSDILPEVFKVRELDGDPVRKKLIAELGKDTNFRIELPCQNGTRAFQSVQSAAKTMSIGMVIEKGARERLKLKSRTNYVVYIENLTAEEVAQFLRHVGAADTKSAGRKPAEAQFDRLVLLRMMPQDHKELSTLMGVDPTATEPSTKGLFGADPRKPLSDSTAVQVGQALAGQGTPRPQPGKPAAKPPEHQALVLAYNPVRPSPNSDDIKHFLQTRKPAKAGTIRVLLVLRG
ncbi:MAG TPA: hypothetical protein VH643_35130 [Gemmataceae bacterium]|jgi:hypothetical protein